MPPARTAPSTPARRRARTRRLAPGACLALLLSLGTSAPPGAPAPRSAARGPAASGSQDTGAAAPSCVEAGDTHGSARGRLSGDLIAPLSGEAFFRAARGPDGRPALQIRLDEPELGRWQLTFTLPGLDTLPRPADLPVVAPDSATALAGAGPRADSARPLPPAPRVAAGELYLFDPTAMAGRTLRPAAGSISLDAVDAQGICGRFDVTWDAPAGGGRELRTRGTFRAVNAGFGEGDRPRARPDGAGRDTSGASNY